MLFQVEKCHQIKIKLQAMVLVANSVEEAPAIENLNIEKDLIEELPLLKYSPKVEDQMAVMFINWKENYSNMLLRRLDHLHLNLIRMHLREY
jgi:hypothetical protein